MSIKKLFIIMLLLASAVSCGEIDPADKSVRIRVHVNDIATKGTVITSSGLEASGSFSMDAYVADDFYDRSTDPATWYDKETYGHFINSGAGGNVRQSAGEWVISGDPKWIADIDSRFWAWHPVNVPGRVIEAKSTVAQYGAESLNFSYETPAVNGSTDADNAEDLIFAYTKRLFKGVDSTINLTFHHALSQVRFCVSTDDGTFDTSLKIKNITISHLKNSGSAVFTDSGNAEVNDKYGTADGFEQFTWSGQAGDFTFGQVYNADFSSLPATGWKAGSYSADGTEYDLHTCQNVFFMIPQTVTDANILTVTFDYNGEELVKEAPISDNGGTEWAADHYYTYKIKATTLGRDIVFSAVLLGWSDRDDIIFI